MSGYLRTGSEPYGRVTLRLRLEKVSTMQTTIENDTLQIPAKLYRIGEVVDYTPFSRQTIHNYTIMGLIQEAKWTEGGHRLYDESVFERLSEIIRLRRTKTLAEIIAIFRKKEDPGSPSGQVPPEQTG
jgi:hypothetical protein